MGSWAYFDPEYETLNIRINPPQVSVDNSSCKDCTLVKVDSMNKPGILLEVVQILTDLDLIITKAYISSDGGWFMDVFHVTDEQGRKIWDSQTIEYIEKALGPKGYTSGVLKASPDKRMGVKSMGDYTTIELIGRDRPGLLSEISAALANLHINVASAEMWTHNSRIACVLYVNDDTTCCAVTDASRLSSLEEQLKNILQGCGNEKNVAHTSFSIGSAHIDRRLHQLLFADRDYERNFSETKLDSLPSFKPKVVIERCEEKDYLVVSVRCKDRPKLMFDIVCTLTDMQYVVFHATISSDGPYASQDWLIVLKHDQGLSLEICAKDRVGLLSEVTRVLRENGLSVMRAGVSTVGEEAMNVFYVNDASGNPVDAKTVDALRKEIGRTMRVDVKKAPIDNKAAEAGGWTNTSFFFRSLLEKFRS
ncbi:ACT domain-containing protein ACR3-like isoform X2 [Primulina huaijiensis]|uniref:ACT domain-containing protein ACR3-like isoform X2 n=1 Tax=Primulina huaijiensis TaxID=1492673 RepID=UPI003CC7867A